jgi:hypothetical protein
MLKKIWAIALPTIIVASFLLALINLMTTADNHWMLQQLMQK